MNSEVTFRVRLEVERSDGASSTVELDHIPPDEVLDVVDMARTLLTAKLVKPPAPQEAPAGEPLAE
jgi:hypothetical protein